MLKNKDNFIENNIIIPRINKKWKIKLENMYKIVHLIVETVRFLTNVHLSLNSTSMTFL